MRQFSTARAGKRLHYELNERIRISSLPLDQILLNTPQSNFNQVNCATAFNAMSKQGCKDERVVNWVLSAFQSQHGERDPRALSSICHSFAQGRLAINLPEGLVSASVDTIDRFTQPQDLSNLAWAFARFNHQSPLLFAKLATRAKLHLPEFKPQELSNLVWALAKLGVCDCELMQAVSHQLTDRGQEQFSTQALVNILWAFATLRVRDVHVLDAISHAIMTRQQDQQPTIQAYCNVIWSLATLEFTCPEPLLHVVEHDLDLTQFTSQGLANTIWALAKFNRFDEFNHRFAPEVICSTRRFTTQAAVNILWAFARQPQINLRVCQQLVRRLNFDQFGALDFSNTMWAMARIGLPLDEVCAKLRSLSSLEGFNSHHLSVILAALAKARHLDLTLLDQITSKLLVDVDSFVRPQELSTVLHSLAVLDYHHLDLVMAIAQSIAKQGLHSGFAFRDIVQLMWSFACLDALANQNVYTIFQLNTNVPVVHSLIAAQQLFQTQLAWKQAHPHTLSNLLTQFNGDWIPNAVQSELDKVKSQTATRAQIATYTLLKPYLPQLQFEHSVSGISVDMFAEPNIVMELDGPFHFFTNEPTTKLGPTTLRVNGKC
ncbi:hypothetical protein BASA81_001468 [Batrachochytrium salamandrivorans]|nr:hypothetical protein BASA81_001468 [Batrachochytrium salamandrivorans]